MILFDKRKTKSLIILRGAQADLCLCCSQTPEDRFSRVEALFLMYHHRETVKTNRLTIHYQVILVLESEVSYMGRNVAQKCANMYLMIK